MAVDPKNLGPHLQQLRRRAHGDAGQHPIHAPPRRGTAGAEAVDGRRGLGSELRQQQGLHAVGDGVQGMEDVEEGDLGRGN